MKMAIVATAVDTARILNMPFYIMRPGSLGRNATAGAGA